MTCERSSRATATRPVGLCVARTALSVLLTCWPPGPEARMASKTTSDALMEPARRRRRAGSAHRRRRTSSCACAWTATETGTPTRRCLRSAVRRRPRPRLRWTEAPTAVRRAPILRRRRASRRRDRRARLLLDDARELGDRELALRRPAARGDLQPDARGVTHARPSPHAPLAAPCTSAPAGRRRWCATRPGRSPDRR